MQMQQWIILLSHFCEKNQNDEKIIISIQLVNGIKTAHCLDNNRHEINNIKWKLMQIRISQT